MKTKPRTPTIEPNFVMRDDIEGKLARAQALAYVLADAAGAEVSVEDENVHQVGLAIAEAVEQARELLARCAAKLEGEHAKTEVTA